MKITIDRSTVEQALEELQALKERGVWGDFHGVTDALKAALAEPVQEPDPWGAGYEAGYAAGAAENPAERQEPDLWSAGFEAGYAAGMAERPAEPVQEPVQEQCKGAPGECEFNGGCMYACAKPEPLYTAAQQALEFVTSERWGTTPYMDVCVYEDAARLREALRAALAEPDIDPVDEYRKGFIDGQIDMRDRPEEQPEPVQEPVAETSAERTLKRMGYTDCGGQFWKPPLGAPAQPQEPVQGPKPLSYADALRIATEAIGRLKSTGPVEGLVGLVRAVEAAHGIGKQE